MKRLTAAIIVLLGAAPAPVSAARSAHCFWVQGRLAYYNGNPSIRIWPKGTSRLLGVLSSTGKDEDPDALPAAVRAVRPSFDRTVWGAFRACPMTRDRPGRMRFVYLTDARRLIVADRRDPGSDGRPSP
jgi:hypothetical protein